VATFFSEFFGIERDTLDQYGAFDVSLVNDLPLFIDPFLLFNSEKQEYQDLHDHIINYLRFLRDKAANTTPTDGLLRLWYCFPEVKQNWLGFSVSGNSGSGLGIDFARALHKNLHRIFNDFGSERITEGSHLEKVCLIAEGVGRDNISDFTTNLIRDYLCRYTERFARDHLPASKIKKVAIRKARFNYGTQTWQTGTYDLPWTNGDYVILTPRDMLTRDENWINKSDLITGFEQIPQAIPDEQLREQINHYFASVLPRHRDREPSRKEISEAAVRTILNFPALIDYYIRLKELQGHRATDISEEKVSAAEYTYVKQLGELQRTLFSESLFYQVQGNTYEEAHERLRFLKDVIENKGGHRIFYHDGKPLEREKDLQILYRLVWFGTPSDVTTEANDGRGPVDFKVSRGATDKTLVEMKLAKNTKLERNLERQVPIYQAASDAKKAIKAIIYFTEAEHERVLEILSRLNVLGHPDIVLIDARSDNKPSGSRA
jgi:tetratricopeptide (TPR) repeat protein